MQFRLEKMRGFAGRESREMQTGSGERFDLLRRISAMLEPLMMVLGILFLLLLLTLYADLPVEIIREAYIDEIIQIIWLVFLTDFILRFVIAPVKSEYLKRNWLIGLSLAIPFIRPLHVFRFMYAFHGFTLVAFLGAADRSLRALRRITRGRVFLYMIVVTAGVILAGAVGVQYFEREDPASPITGLSDAIWWSATLVTTLTHELDVLSTEARLIAFALRLYGLNVFCFFMASIASYLIGVDSSFSRIKEGEGEQVDPVHAELRLLRAELNEMRALLAVQPAKAAAEEGETHSGQQASEQVRITDRTRLPVPPRPPGPDGSYPLR